MSSARKGKFILFEGCDGTGKTTQALRLKESGICEPSIQIQFPDRTTTIGQMINSYLQKKEGLVNEVIHLLFTANRWEKAGEILENLEKGVNVIADRYIYSGVAYSVVKGLDYDWCMSPEKGLPIPDAVIYLDIDPEILKSRPGFGEEVYEKVDTQKAVRDAYSKMKNDTWYVVDASKPIEEVTQEVHDIVKKILSQ